MLIINLRSRVFAAIADGIQFDSLRRRLNRAGIFIAGKNVRQVWDRAIIEARVATAVSQVRNPKARFRRGTTLAPKSMKHPFEHEYVVELEYRDSKGGTFLKPITIKSDSSLSLEEQWERAQLEGEGVKGLYSPKGFVPVTVTPTKTLIGYYSV